MHFVFVFFSKNVEKVCICYTLKLVDEQSSIDRTKAVTQHHFEKSFYINIKHKSKSRNPKKTIKIVVFLNVCFVLLICVFRVVVSVCFVGVILSWCPLTWHVYSVCNIFSWNIYFNELSACEVLRTDKMWCHIMN